MRHTITQQLFLLTRCRIVGGEIRDEGATGVGSKPKLVLLFVSNLYPWFRATWETDFGKPDRIVTPLDIMIEGPLGGAAFNNEFGRPAINGYFRTYAEKVNSFGGEEVRGYHKPIMLAGGLGNIRDEHVQKGEISVGANLIALGGPAMNIGLGGGAASSMASGQSAENLDFASVQRDNPEMERRCQKLSTAVGSSVTEPNSLHPRCRCRWSFQCFPLTRFRRWSRW